MSQTMTTATVPATFMLNEEPVQSVQPTESVLLLDGALYVAASVTLKRDAVNSRLTAFAVVRALNSDGSPLLDGHGASIQATHSRSCAANELMDYGGEDRLMKDALLIALGDTSDSTLAVADDNIRAGVIAGSVSGDHSTPHTLLGLG